MAIDPLLDKAGVIHEERAQIVERRRKAFGVEPAKPGDDPGATVGLALSGGGIRSAMFNLGVLQSMHASGFLRHVDYMATVSGGGYIGGFVSYRISQAVAEAGVGVDVDFHDSEHTPLMDDLSAGGAGGPRPDTEQRYPNVIRRFDFLARPFEFFYRWALGTLTNVLLIGSGLIFACLLVAYLFRAIDEGTALDRLIALVPGEAGAWLTQRTTNSDVFRAFLPALAILALYAGLYGLGRAFPRSREQSRIALYRVRKALGVAWLLSIFCAFAVMAGNFDTEWIGGRDLTYRFEPSQGGVFIDTLGIAQVVLAVVTFLASRKFLEFGRSPLATVQGKVFLLVAGSLALLSPVFLVYLFAREDISGMRVTLERARILMRAEEAEAADREETGHEADDPSDPVDSITADPDRVDALERLAAAEIRKEPRGRTTPIDEMIRNELARYLAFYNEQTKAEDPLRFSEAPNGLDPRFNRRYVPIQRHLERLIQDALRDEGVEWADTGAGADYWPAGQWAFLRHFDGGDPAHRTLIDFDQAWRYDLLTKSLVAFILLALTVNLNRTSMHNFYRDRLADAFLADAWGEWEPMPMAGLDTVEAGYPYHLISATLNLPYHPTEERGADRNFLFSALYCGSEVTGFLRTSDYDAPKHKLNLAESMAISGAAFTPVQSNSLLKSALLLVLNWRLGQWYPHPRLSSNRRAWWRPMSFHDTAPTFANIGLIAISASLTGWWAWVRGRDSTAWKDRRLLFLSDGAHYDNLGLGLLLDRRCRLIVVSDVSNDSRFELADFISVIRRSEAHGIRFTDPSGRIALDSWLARWFAEQGVPASAVEAKPGRAGRLPRRAIAVGRVRYPEDAPGQEPGHLIIIKPSYWDPDSMPLELRNYVESHANFPHEPDMDQFFTKGQADAYRLLGEHVGRMLKPGLVEPGESPDSLFGKPPDSVVDVGARIAEGMGPIAVELGPSGPFDGPEPTLD